MTTLIRARTPVREKPIWQLYNRFRYAILFYALLLTLLVLPIASAAGLPTKLIKALLAFSLLSAVMPNANRHTRLGLFAGVILLVAARYASEGGYILVRPALILALEGLVGLAAAAGTLRFVVTTRAVDSETLYAALSTYLLAGVFFGQMYWSLEQLWPGSVVGPDPMSEVVSVYYSFVTLATLGYGDYLPRTDIARGLATFEVIGGQLFLAVMVARLIGMFVPDNTDRDVTPPPGEA